VDRKLETELLIDVESWPGDEKTFVHIYFYGMVPKVKVKC